MNKYFIASCVFTSQFPELSFRIQEYVKNHYDLQIVRCCIPNYKLKSFEEKMPEGYLRQHWMKLPDSADFQKNDQIYSLCHNCSNIIEEMRPYVHVHSLWELIDADNSFSFPDFHGMKAYVQDCWRSKQRTDEQNAVRNLLSKMNIEIVEVPHNGRECEFCGASLYREQPRRNPILAPKHYIDDAKGKFLSHTPMQQKEIMTDYCKQFASDKVICYCHYCLEGLLMGGADAVHVAELLFDRKEGSESMAPISNKQSY